MKHLKHTQLNMQSKRIITLTLGAAACATSLAATGTQYLDNYAEAARLFGVASATQHIDKDLSQRLTAPYYFAAGHKSYKTLGYSYDFATDGDGDECE